jgi:predicted unusual protein kinase regulating ubiquinone biosynthesis (AarF/ABC1/UbiB family)
MIFEVFCVFKCIYYFFMYKIYTYLNISKTVLLDNIYNFIINLGPFFIKIFQNLSSKKLLPIDLLELSEKSKDNVYYNTNDYNNILQNIKRTNFKLDSEIPYKAGSICLVYKGEYGGNKSIIKICHNNIKEKMENNILIINFLIKMCNFFGCYGILINNTNFEGIINNIDKQINLYQEVNNIKLYRKELEKHKLLNLMDVPEIYKYDYNYIIESYINGLSYYEITKKYQNKTFECITLIQILSRYQNLHFNIIHGDLHTSNYLYKIDNDKIKLYLIDFGLCTTINKHMLYGRGLAYKYYIPEIFTTHPIGTILTYIKSLPEIRPYVTKDNFKETFKFLKKLRPNINQDLLIKHIIDNIDQITRKEMFNIQFENYNSLNILFQEIKNEGIPLSYRVDTKEKIDLNLLISQNSFFQTNELSENLVNGKRYCDLQFYSQNLYDNFLEYYIKYSIENLPYDKYLDDIDDKIKMSYQQIIYMFQMKYKEQLNRKDIKQILDQYQTEIKDYLYHFFYRNQYYTQRYIIIEKMYSIFYLNSDLLHGMIEYLHLKKPNGLIQEYYEIPVSDINTKHIIIKNNKIIYTNCEKGIFKGDEIIKMDNLDVTKYTLEECLKSIKICKFVTFKDCFSLI